MKAANHHLRGIDEVIVESRHLTRAEPACAARFFQLASERKMVTDGRGSEEAILEVAGEEGTVLEVLDRPSLGVQHSLNSLDDLIAVGQERLEKLDMRRKRYPAKRFTCHTIPRPRNRSPKYCLSSI